MAASTPSLRFLTKSLFAKACECPRKVAYALNPSYAKQKPSSFVKNLAENGMKIGVYSRLLYRDGIEIGSSASENFGSMQDIIEETNILLSANETVTLFEAAIQSGPFYIRADILRKTDNHLHLMEVKAKSWDSRQGVEELMLNKSGSIKAEYLPYLQDVAFQKHVTQLAFPDMTVSASLVLPDKALVNTKIPNLNSLFRTVQDTSGKKRIHLDEASRQKILDAQELLVVEVDVDELVDKILHSELKYPGSRRGQVFRDVVAEWGSYVATAKDLAPYFKPSIGSRCSACECRTESSSGKGTSGFEQCWQETTGLGPESQDGLVVDIFSGGKTTDTLIKAGKFRMAELKPDDLGLSEDDMDQQKKGSGFSRSYRQWLQVSDVESPVIDREYLEREMLSWKYPYQFIDFETILPALPYSTNKAPYSPLAFQFSHHLMHGNGNVEHVSNFLHAHPGECPNQSFLEALSESLGAWEGTIFSWGAHEVTTLVALLRSESGTYPLIESLLAGGDRGIVDLMKVLSKGYYAPGSGASSSMKKLLLPTMQWSTELKLIYSKPSYSGKNFTNMQWWVESSETGVPCDPYYLLGDFATNTSSVAHGGDAMAAYELLQREDLEPGERSAAVASLLRYCELDTLAMAMMVQGVEDLMG